MVFYRQHIHDVLSTLHAKEEGLSNAEAEKRIREYGPNSIRLKGTPLWRKIVEPFWNVFMAVLILAAFVSLLRGDYLDAIIVIVIIGISAIIYYVQQFSTERILRALRKKSTETVEVLRSGKISKIEAENLVPGDIILLHEGEKVPADARLIHAHGVRTDEALLTGESMPVEKHHFPVDGDKKVYEQANMLFQGSFIISGEAKAVVTTTGESTEFGHLAGLSQNTNVTSPVQKKIDTLITQIIIVILSVAVIVMALALYRGIEFTEALRFVLTLSVSAVPEGLPVAITVILVLGMRRMAEKKALIRNMRAIEAIGVITTIATDKTGTLTKNLLSVQGVWQPKHISYNIFEAVLLATNSHTTKSHDPLDTALHAHSLKERVTIPKKATHTLNLPFDQQKAMSGNLWKIGNTNTLYLKGSPEHILHRANLSSGQHEEAEHMLHSLTSQGLRVIALAKTEVKKDFNSLEDVKDYQLHFIGFITVSDTIRTEAKRSIVAAQGAGVTVRMITGDHFETAYSIGRTLGIAEHRSQVFDSRSLEVLSDAKLTRVIKDARVFSRVVPEQKYRILELLKKQDITAMTGDGVNDVPAIANADVGIAMGSGSQIAKEASDIILLDNNFRSIIDAMREGRIIFSNIRRMLFYLLATSSGEVLTMLGSLILGLPLPVAAIQILWINLVTDTAMVIPLGLEKGERGVMDTPPRKPNQPILGKFIISRILLIAIAMALVALGSFYVFLQTHGVDYARTITFSTLVVMQWANAFNARSESESLFSRFHLVNWKLVFGFFIGLSLQLMALFGPLQSVLHVVPVAVSDIGITAAIGAGVIVGVAELHKLIGRLS